MNKKSIFIISSSIFSLGILTNCGGNPVTPSPTPVIEHPIDFDINPTDDSYITVDKGATRNITISFKDASYIENVKSIEWSVPTSSSNYLSIQSESKNVTSITFKASEINTTPLDTQAEIIVKVTSKYDNLYKSKTCYINVYEPCEEQNLTFDNTYYSYRKNNKISKGSRYRFTADLTSGYKYTYFGMSDYEGKTTPYFDIGFKNNKKRVNVTAVYKKDTLLKSNQMYVYSPNSLRLLLFENNLFSSGDIIKVECIITEDLDTGFWAYVGNASY